MKRWRAGLLAMLAAMAPGVAVGADRAPVLVELFTSEGCSTCPPADKLLEKLDAAAVVLSEHVTYWDSKDWRDRYSLAEITSWQMGYAGRFGLDSTYTPEMVVNGEVEFNGSNAKRAADEIAKASDRVKAVPRLSWADRGVQIQIDGARAGDRVYLALADDSASAKVTGGENKGQELHYVAVCRELRRAGKVPPGGAYYELIQLPAKARAQRVIVWTQTGDSGKVASAALLLPAESGPSAAAGGQSN